LPQAISDLVEKLKVNTLMQADLQLDGQMPDLDREQAVELFHIAQEALTNVAKHSGASSVEVRLAGDDRALSLEVSDNGVGFDPEARYDSLRQGLRNIKDRARRLGASLSIDSAPGRTSVRLALTVPETAL